MKTAFAAAAVAALLVSAGLAFASQTYNYSGGSKVVHCAKQDNTGYYKAISNEGMCSRVAASSACEAVSATVVIYWKDQGRDIYASYPVTKMCTSNGGVYAFD